MRLYCICLGDLYEDYLYRNCTHNFVPMYEYSTTTGFVYGMGLVGAGFPMFWIFENSRKTLTNISILQDYMSCSFDIVFI